MSKSIKDKKEQILDSALDLFAERGVENTQTSTIAKNANVANGTLFHYFKTKNILVNELYIKIKSDYYDYLTNNIDKNDIIKNQLIMKWEKTLYWGLENPSKFRCLNDLGNSTALSDESRENGYKIFDYFIKIFRKAIKENIIKKRDVKLIISMQNAYLDGVFKYIINENDVKKQNETIKNAASDFWQLLKK